MITKYVMARDAPYAYELKDDIIRSFIPDIQRLAYSQTRNTNLHDDMVSYALTALSDCLENYDPTKVKSFWGYAYGAIKRAFLLSNASAYGNPNRRIDQSRILRAIKKLKVQGKPISYEAIDELTGRGVVYIKNLVYPQSLENFQPELDPRATTTSLDFDPSQVYDEIDEFIWIDSLRALLTPETLPVLNALLNGKERCDTMKELDITTSAYNHRLRQIKKTLRDLQKGIS